MKLLTNHFRVGDCWNKFRGKKNFREFILLGFTRNFM